MKRIVLIFFFSVFSICSHSQPVDLDSTEFGYRIHYSGGSKKWLSGGQMLYNKDSVLYFQSELGFSKDTCVFYLVREWYYSNGNIKRSILVDFKKRRRARVIDKEYSESGKLVNSIHKCVKRKPEQNSYDKVDWGAE